MKIQKQNNDINEARKQIPYVIKLGKWKPRQKRSQL